MFGALTWQVYSVLKMQTARKIYFDHSLEPDRREGDYVTDQQNEELAARASQRYANVRFTFCFKYFLFHETMSDNGSTIRTISPCSLVSPGLAFSVCKKELLPCGTLVRICIIQRQSSGCLDFYLHCCEGVNQALCLFLLN